MKVREARAVAGRWVAEHAAAVAGFAGALLGGSLAWLPEDAELPATADVDVMVVTGDPGAGPGRSKRRYGGVLLEATVVPWHQLASPEQVLASYHPRAAHRRPAQPDHPAARPGRPGAGTGRRCSGSWPPTPAA